VLLVWFISQDRSSGSKWQLPSAFDHFKFGTRRKMQKLRFAYCW
jgi:hypothetical protein